MEALELGTTGGFAAHHSGSLCSVSGKFHSEMLLLGFGSWRQNLPGFSGGRRELHFWTIVSPPFGSLRRCIEGCGMYGCAKKGCKAESMLDTLLAQKRPL